LTYTGENRMRDAMVMSSRESGKPAFWSVLVNLDKFEAYDPKCWEFLPGMQKVQCASRMSVVGFAAFKEGKVEILYYEPLEASKAQLEILKRWVFLLPDIMRRGYITEADVLYAEGQE
jgi:hypothetical protein